MEFQLVFIHENQLLKSKINEMFANNIGWSHVTGVNFVKYFNRFGPIFGLKRYAMVYFRAYCQKC